MWWIALQEVGLNEAWERNKLVVGSDGICKYTLSEKNVPPLTCSSLNIHDPIAIIFSRGVTEKARNQMMLCFPTSPFWCFSITLQKRKPRRQRTGALCVQHSPTAAVLLTSFLLPPKSWMHWLQDLGSHTTAWVWVVSQKDWILAIANTASEKCNFCVSSFAR